MHIEYRPKHNVSGIVKNLKGRSSQILQQEFPSLKKRYWGNHFWASGYGAWSSGNITDEMVNAYLEHHRSDRSDNSNFILEWTEDFKSLAQTSALLVQSGLVLTINKTINLNTIC